VRGSRLRANLRPHGPCGKDRAALEAFLYSGRFSPSRCRSSVVEHSLGKGEVVSSILTGSTKQTLKNQHLSERALPCPPRLDPEQAANVCQKVGENWGSLFSLCPITRNRLPALLMPTYATSPETAPGPPGRRRTATPGTDTYPPRPRPSSLPPRSARTTRK
jgi:hypothetical protein